MKNTSTFQNLLDRKKCFRAITDDYQILIQQLNERQQEIGKFVKSLEDFDTLWDNALLEEKKHFLRAIIKDIRAGNGKVEIDFRF